MGQVRSDPGYPTSSSANTYTVRFRARQTENTGVFSATIPGSYGLNDLAIGFLANWENVATYDQILDLVVTHVSNSNILDWWNPVAGSPLQLVRDAAAGRVGGNTTYLNLLFDGQFGPVLAT